MTKIMGILWKKFTMSNTLNDIIETKLELDKALSSLCLLLAGSYFTFKEELSQDEGR